MGLKVVIADDETIIRLDIREQLQGHGYEGVGEASDGFDAINLCKTLSPDVILLDIKMPILDGLSAAKVITEENLAPCVISVSYTHLDVYKRQVPWVSLAAVFGEHNPAVAGQH